MSNTLVISSVTAPAYTTPDGKTPDAGIYYVTPKFGIGSPPWISAKEAIEVEHLVPGVGIGTTRMGDFQPRTIHAHLIFVDTTTAAAMGRFLAAADTFAAQARYNITLRGTPINGCKLVKGSTQFVGQDFRAGKSHLVYAFQFKELGV